MKQELHDYMPSLEHWAREYLSPSSPKAVSLNMYVHPTETSVHVSHLYCSVKKTKSSNSNNPPLQASEQQSSRRVPRCRGSDHRHRAGRYRRERLVAEIRVEGENRCDGTGPDPKTTEWTASQNPGGEDHPPGVENWEGIQLDRASQSGSWTPALSSWSPPELSGGIGANLTALKCMRFSV